MNKIGAANLRKVRTLFRLFTLQIWFVRLFTEKIPFFFQRNVAGARQKKVRLTLTSFKQLNKREMSGCFCAALCTVSCCVKQRTLLTVWVCRKNRFVRHQIKAKITSSRFHIHKLHKKQNRSSLQKVSTNNRRIFDNMQRMPNVQKDDEICHGIPTKSVFQQTNKKYFAKLCTETFGWILYAKTEWLHISKRII